ncbi:SprT-like protease [Microbacterium phage Big4]|nr:SprT-like protease [Microbacterium phage Big4]URP22373.1 SprT-like protease [Microbacterium phage Big4]
MNIQQITQLGYQIMAEHGLHGWTIVWDNARNRGGQCRYSSRTISLSRLIVPTWEDAEIRNVLLHEIAHALTPGHSHDAVWRRQLLSMGGDGRRTHNNATVPGRWLATCDHCGVEVGRRHRLTKGARYGLHSKCMKPVRWVDTGLQHAVSSR